MDILSEGTEILNPQKHDYPDLLVKGRLAAVFTSFWSSLLSDAWVKEVVTKGYKIAFIQIPPQWLLASQLSINLEK